MKKYKTIGIVALLAMLTLTACNSHWQSTETDFEGNCWAVGDTLRLDFENTDTSQVFQLGFPITLTEDYPFHNIYLHAILKAPSGDQSMIPSEFVLADRTGAWLSKPNGDEIPFVLYVPEGIRFNQVGKYSLRLFHFMRDPNLCGIEDAGIVIDPLQPQS